MNSFISNLLPAVDPVLEGSYNLRARHPERTDIYRAYAERSVVTRQRPAALLDLRYGPRATSLVDVFLPDTATPAPLLIFIHGGYWRALDKHDFSFVADAYLSAGVAVAMPNYALAPRATVSDIVDEVCSSIAWLVSKEGRCLGYDADHVVISGHSAGGHMAATAVRRDRAQAWSEQLRGCVCLSGLFDLEPLLRTSVNHDLHMTLAEARRLNVYASELVDVPLLFAAGALETSGFQSQSVDFARQCQRYGRTAEAMLVPRRNHFDVMEEFADPDSPLFCKTLALLRSPRRATLPLTDLKEK